MNTNKRCTIKSSIHFSNLSDYIPKLLKNEKYVDVTLSCEGRKFKCHRIVLGAASRLLDGLFADNQCQHPIVILPSEIAASELKNAINFMYYGKVDLRMNELSEFMKVAQLLKLRGFRDLDSSTDLQMEIIEEDVSSHQIINIPEIQNKEVNDIDDDEVDGGDDDDDDDDDDEGENGNDLDGNSNIDGNIDDIEDDDDEVPMIDENELDENSDLELDYDAILAQETANEKKDKQLENKQDTINKTSCVGKIRVTNDEFLFEKNVISVRKNNQKNVNEQENHLELPKNVEVKTEYVEENSTMNPEDDFSYENIVCAPSIAYIYSNSANGMHGQSENTCVDFETNDNYKTYQKTEEKHELKISNKSSIWSTYYGSSKAIRSKPTVKRERKVAKPVKLIKNVELTEDEVVLRSPRSNQPRTYSTKALYDALMAVKEGESIYRASREHAVPRKTLRNWMKRWNIKSKHPMPVQLREAAGRKKKKEELLNLNFKTDIFENNML